MHGFPQKVRDSLISAAQYPTPLSPQMVAKMVRYVEQLHIVALLEFRRIGGAPAAIVEWEIELRLKALQN